VELKCLKYLARTLTEVGSVCLFSAMVLVGADVFMRNFFNAPIPGTLELTEFLPVILTYCGFTYTSMLNRHINTTFGLDLVGSATLKSLIKGFSTLLMMLFLSLLIWQTTVEGLRSWQIKEYSQGLIDLPRYPIKILIPIALAVGWLHYFEKFILLFKKRSEKEK
jgi:TRAP-type C4-dicarboxylate transport system permease small subunit